MIATQPINGQTAGLVRILRQIVCAVHLPARLLCSESADRLCVAFDVSTCLHPGQQCQGPSQECQNPSQQCQDPGQQCQNPSQQCQDPGQQCQGPSQQCQNPSQQCQDPTNNAAQQQEHRRDQRKLHVSQVDSDVSSAADTGCPM